VQTELWLCSDCESLELLLHSHAPRVTKTPLIVLANRINFDGKIWRMTYSVPSYLSQMFNCELIQTWGPKRRQDIFNGIFFISPPLVPPQLSTHPQFLPHCSVSHPSSLQLAASSNRTRTLRLPTNHHVQSAALFMKGFQCAGFKMKAGTTANRYTDSYRQRPGVCQCFASVVAVGQVEFLCAVVWKDWFLVWVLAMPREALN